MRHSRWVVPLILASVLGCGNRPPTNAAFACSGSVCPAFYQCREGYCFPLGGDGGCFPRSCRQDFSCGEVSDGCGGKISCGGCTAPQTCGGGGTPNECGCPAQSAQALCTANGFACGTLKKTDSCGVMREVMCGSCPADKKCSVTGSCVGCTAETDAALCSKSGATCGTVLMLDGCDKSRSVECGSCLGAAPDGGNACLVRKQPCVHDSDCCDRRSCFNGRCENLDGGN